MADVSQIVIGRAQRCFKFKLFCKRHIFQTGVFLAYDSSKPHDDITTKMKRGAIV
ncbi:hypothetical protein CY34DRAFT_811007 [Suillus luteus UH-Slu-Lm8-n1]|uniref:Uncharacterized protein n=1 Tax=Suillus luteus UH-Slu-Lm8-n1 TaxID=930992 RepID=A0A0C9ZH77_9AGAM|nr:hypothetical protein CY34DRAFT_811007 [Suillus luteus UH-Slu-Lm8-n1]